MPICEWNHGLRHSIPLMYLLATDEMERISWNAFAIDAETNGFECDAGAFAKCRQSGSPQDLAAEAALRLLALFLPIRRHCSIFRNSVHQCLVLDSAALPVIFGRLSPPCIQHLPASPQAGFGQSNACRSGFAGHLVAPATPAEYQRIAMPLTLRT